MDRMEAQDWAVKICLSLPIYSSVEDKADKNFNHNLHQNLSGGDFGFDCYCIHCKRITPFKVIRDRHHSKLNSAEEIGLLEDGVFTLHAHCQRFTSHIYSYIFRFKDDIVIKIGQYPSLEDIATSDLARFRPVLEKEDFSELHRAGGLASHGIGIGSFVYLRRIFERLINRHYASHVEAAGSIEGWTDMRIEERIAAIADRLPNALVENRAIYSILSKGIHELDEETCKTYFPIVRSGIVAILEEDLQDREKARAADELRKSIADIAGEIKSAKGKEAKSD